MRLLDLYAQHYEPKRLLGSSVSTRRQYRIQIAAFERFLGREATGEDLNDETICRFLQWIIDRGRRPATANKARSHLLALWRYLADRRIVEVSPDVPAIPEPLATPRAWSREELSQLLKACETYPGSIAGILASKWWHTLHLVMWDTGERIGAIRAIEWTDLDLNGGWLVVRAETRKGRKQPRTYRIHSETIAGLRKISEPERKLVFPWDRCHTHLWYVYRRIRERAGLPTGRRDSFHRMRRSVASYGAEAGLDPTMLMGHSSRQVTERYYLDPTIVKVPQASEHLFRPDDKQAS